MRHFAYSIIAILIALASSAQAQTINLAGAWTVALDPDDLGYEAIGALEQSEISLPSTPPTTAGAIQTRCCPLWKSLCCCALRTATSASNIY